MPSSADPRARDSRALLPSPAWPLVHFAGAHLAFALACAALVLDPAMALGFHYQPRVMALVHLVTLGWITGSILGAWYIVGPLAFGAPLRGGVADGLAAAAFWIGTAGMAAAFWTGRYDRIAHAAPLVLAAIGVIGTRVAIGLWRSRVPWGVSLHVVLAFANVLGAGIAGMAIAWARADGTLTLAPQAVAFAHGHAAVLGWAAMMIVGVSYRLVPMFLPAAMPSGGSLATSAILLEIGALGLAAALTARWTTLPWTLVAGLGFTAFFVRVRAMLGSRRPRPVELPRPDWSTWQAFNDGVSPRCGRGSFSAMATERPLPDSAVVHCARRAGPGGRRRRRSPGITVPLWPPTHPAQALIFLRRLSHGLLAQGESVTSSRQGTILPSRRATLARSAPTGTNPSGSPHGTPRA